MTRLSKLIKTEIDQALLQLDSLYGLANLGGFALATDDDVRTLYHVVYTHQWLAQQEEDVACFYVEWEQSADEDLFLGVSELMSAQADNAGADESDWAMARDQRFTAIVDALAALREDGVLAPDTLLIAGSTDPSDHLLQLEQAAVKRLNSEHTLQAYMRAMDAEE